jgi:hypothetical protein
MAQPLKLLADRDESQPVMTQRLDGSDQGSICAPQRSCAERLRREHYVNVGWCYVAGFVRLAFGLGSVTMP